ncbi:uncharacterized protein LOC130458091 [Monodelphis domestica]|uniref:uncharacterized protein LOC130458091 n=1 Tax=Monodelphis domestica TaxID=13616 RepID=UPI0024E23678|nr:uncharacterized protein LOC130458091 [Monodelphis domestica]
MPETENWRTGLRYDRQRLSSDQPEPRSPLDSRGTEGTRPPKDDSYSEVTLVAKGTHSARYPGHRQPVQKDYTLEGIDPGSSQDLPGSEANRSAGPGGSQHSLHIQGSASSGKLKVLLCNHALWLQFALQQNEMVLDKQGRIMFPFLTYKIQGMDPSAYYHVFVEVAPVDKHHWRYQRGQWLPFEEDKKEEDNLPGNRFYRHPDSPNTGAHWMGRDVSFKKLKLTNKETACKNGSQAPILLKSLHKYQPRLHIEEVSTGKQCMPASSSSTHTFSFPDTEFITVTCYYNPEIKRLKIDLNPFARTFRGNSRTERSSTKTPPAGECTGRSPPPPALLVSNSPAQVQECPGQGKKCNLMHGSQPPSGHPYDSRDSNSTTSLALPLVKEGVDPDLLPCISPHTVSYHPNPDTSIIQRNCPPAISSCTSNGNSMDYLESGSLKALQADTTTQQEEGLQEQLCLSSSRSPLDFSGLKQRPCKKRCLSPVDSATDVSTSVWKSEGQQVGSLLVAESYGNSSSEVASGGSSYTVGLQEATPQTKEKVFPTPWPPIQVSKPPWDHPSDSTDSGKRIRSYDLHTTNPGPLPCLGLPESKKQLGGLSHRQARSLQQPEPGSPLEVRGADRASPCSEEDWDPEVATVPERVRTPASPTSFQPARNNRVREGIDPGSSQVLPGSEANPSAGPGGSQHSLHIQGSASSGKLKVLLCNHALWLQFALQQNEMVLDKQGRIMFPFLTYKIQGMDPSAYYHVFVEVAPVDKHHWRYQRGQWLPFEEDKKEEDNLPGNRFYRHPDSPNTGAHWMGRDVSFKKLKLTNKETACKNGSQAPILLKSLHKYQPRLHIEEVSTGKQCMPASSSSTHTFSFPDTEFITVTCYYNPEIKRLKIDLNPFARTFRGNSRTERSSTKTPPAGECTGRSPPPPALLVSNSPAQVQECPGQGKKCNLMHGSQPPSGHPYDSRDSNSTTSLALPLVKEGVDPDLLPCISPHTVSYHPNPDTSIIQRNCPPAISSCTSNGNSMDYLESGSLKALQADTTTQQEEGLQEQLCLSSSRSPLDFSGLKQRPCKKRCLSPVDSATDVSTSVWKSEGQQVGSLLVAESYGNSSSEVASGGSSYTVGLQEATPQTKEKVFPTPWPPIQVSKPPWDHPSDSTDSGKRIGSYDLHTTNPGPLPCLGLPESKKQLGGLSHRQARSLQQPEPGSPLEVRGADRASPCSEEDWDPEVATVPERVRTPASPTSFQPARNNRVREGIDPGSSQVLPGSEANPSAGPGGSQHSLHIQGSASSGKLHDSQPPSWYPYDSGDSSSTTSLALPLGMEAVGLLPCISLDAPVIPQLQEWKTREQEGECRLGENSVATAPQNLFLKAPAILYAYRENEFPLPPHSIQETQSPSELPSDSSDLDLDAILLELLPDAYPSAMPYEPSQDDQ